MHSNEEKHTLNMDGVNYLSSLSQYMNDCHYLEKKTWKIALKHFGL